MTTETEVKNIIKSILNVRCRDGATIADIQRDFEEIVGQPLLDVTIDNYMNSIDCVYCIESPNSAAKWYVQCENMQHITQLIMEQKPLQPRRIQPQKKPMNRTISDNDCFFKDNLVYKHMRKQMQQSPYQQDVNRIQMNGLQYSMVSPATPSYLERADDIHAQLVGDDFFRLLVARDADDQIRSRKNGVQHNGLCVSGLSIQAAAKLVEYTSIFKSSNLLINVGSVDILHGHTLYDMCCDYDHLIKACELRGLQPIIATLAPIANGSHSPEMRDKLLKFNNFLIDKYQFVHPIIDIWSQMIKPSGHINFECYQNESVYVSGSDRPHVLWNRTGRSMVRKYILWELKHILNMNYTERVYIDA